MPSLCHSIKSEYDHLQTLTKEFVSACAKGKSEGNFQHLTPQELRTLQLLKKRVEKARDAFKDKLFVSPAEAERIMNKDMGKDETKKRFFGLDAIKTAFGITLNKKDLPPIPFSTQELKEAQTRGDYLIYRTDHIPDPSSPRQGGATKGAAPLTMEKIAELVQPTLTANNQGKALFNTDWYATDPFYTKETPRKGWALVSKEPLPTSTSKDYVEQTAAIIDHITTTILNNKNININLKERIAYQEAITEWHQFIQDTFPNRTNEEINRELRGTNWKQYTEQLSALSITQITRHTTPEAFFDMMLLRASTKSDKFLSNQWTWTSTRSSSGNLVYVGDADVSGAYVNRWYAGNRDGYLGVLFVRSFGPAPS